MSTKFVTSRGGGVEPATTGSFEAVSFGFGNALTETDVSMWVGMFRHTAGGRRSVVIRRSIYALDDERGAMNSDGHPRDELPDAFSIDEDVAVLLTMTDGGMLLGRRF